MAEQQPIIVKKIKKAAHGHHGGAWKIAYADFVTAMMAFFLLMWLLNAVTEEQLEGISNYFAPVSASQATSGAGGVLGGQTIGEEGAVERTTSRPSVTMNLPPPKAGSGSEADADEGAEQTAGEISEDDAEELLRKAEEEQFEEAEQALKEAIESVPSLKNLAKNLLVDNTPEGLRIQLIDREGLAMFPRGGAEMYLHTKKIMELVSKIILQMPQNISISGHTDASKFVTDTGYSNWELSADRANAARRALMDLKVPENRVQLVVGKAATEPLFADDPKDPRNRRLSIVLLRGTGEQKLPPGTKVKKTDSGTEGDAPAPNGTAPGTVGEGGMPEIKQEEAAPTPAAPPAPPPSAPAAPTDATPETPTPPAAPPQAPEGASSAPTQEPTAVPPSSPSPNAATPLPAGPRTFTIGPAPKPKAAPEPKPEHETTVPAPAPKPSGETPRPPQGSTGGGSGSVTIRLGQ